MEKELFMQWLREGFYDGPNRNLNETELYKQLSDENKEFFDRFSGRVLFPYQKVHLLLALLKRQEKEEKDNRTDRV
jgi:hypothetical protein